MKTKSFMSTVPYLPLCSLLPHLPAPMHPRPDILPFAGWHTCKVQTPTHLHFIGKAVPNMVFRSLQGKQRPIENVYKPKIQSVGQRRSFTSLFTLMPNQGVVHAKDNRQNPLVLCGDIGTGAGTAGPKLFQTVVALHLN